MDTASPNREPEPLDFGGKEVIGPRSNSMPTQHEHTAKSKRRQRRLASLPPRLQWVQGGMCLPSISHGLLEGSFDVGDVLDRYKSDQGEEKHGESSAGKFSYVSASKETECCGSGDSDSTPPSSEEPSSQPSPIPLVLATIVCGCLCQAPYELMNTRDRGCGDLISLAEYLYGIAASVPWLLSLNWTSPAAGQSRFQVGFFCHVSLGCLSVAYAASINQANATPLPMPVLITMKNGNLVMNMVVGLLVLKKKYSLQHLLAVILVTGGMATTALNGMPLEPGSNEFSVQALLGVAFLTVALLMRALQGAMQEVFIRRSGGSPVAELLFFRSLLGLPYFVARKMSIRQHAEYWWSAPAVSGLVWPSMFGLLAMNLIFDYLCKVTMTRLVGQIGALSANLVLTCQRFISFVLSALILNPTTDGTPMGLWFGSCLVLVGTVAYSTARSDKSLANLVVHNSPKKVQ